jgi:hypothetical protein
MVMELKKGRGGLGATSELRSSTRHSDDSWGTPKHVLFIALF